MMARMLEIGCCLVVFAALFVTAGCERDLTVGSSLDGYLKGTWEGTASGQNEVMMRITFDGDRGAMIETGPGLSTQYHCRYFSASETTASIGPYENMVRVERLSRDSIRFHPVERSTRKASDSLYQLVFHRQR